MNSSLSKLLLLKDQCAASQMTGPGRSQPQPEALGTAEDTGNSPVAPQSQLSWVLQGDGGAGQGELVSGLSSRSLVAWMSRSSIHASAVRSPCWRTRPASQHRFSAQEAQGAATAAPRLFSPQTLGECLPTPLLPGDSGVGRGRCLCSRELQYNNM